MATRVSEPGAVFYRGPSLLTGDPIVGIVTGLESGSANPKTGPMVQAWILRPDLPPMDAKRQNLDDAICGDCKLRGDGGFGAVCYVAAWQGPNNVYKRFTKGDYLEASWLELQALVEGRHLRLGAYGDPAAVPFEIWRMLLATAGGHVAYTHQWRTCDRRLQAIAMASVDSVHEFHVAHLAGWRTFRVRKRSDELLSISNIENQHNNYRIPLEFVCPASDEGEHRSTCQRCQLCRGTSSPARSVAIVVHGKPGNLKAFGVDPRGLFRGRPRKSSPPPAHHVESTLDAPRIQGAIEPLRAKFYRPGELR